MISDLKFTNVTLILAINPSFRSKPIEEVGRPTLADDKLKIVVAWTPEDINITRKGDGKSVVSAVKAFLNEFPRTLWYHNDNEDHLWMFDGLHFHVIVQNAYAKDLTHYEFYNKLR